MKLIFLTITGLIVLNFAALSQDIIVRKNGEKINCKLTKQDNDKIYFTINNISTYINKSDVVEIIRQDEKKADTNNITIDRFSAGLGYGFNNGGLIGGNLLIYPHKNVGVFAGLGWAIASPGYNVGIKLRSTYNEKRKNIAPFFTVMYGYNTAIIVIDLDSKNKLFYNFTLGGGIDIKPKPYSQCYFSFALYVPIRNKAPFDYIDYLETNHNIEFKTGLVPIAYSVTYHKILK